MVQIKYKNNNLLQVFFMKKKIFCVKLSNLNIYVSVEVVDRKNFSRLLFGGRNISWGDKISVMSEEFSLTHQIDGSVLIIRTKGYLNDLGAEQVDEICSENLDNDINKIVINLEQSPLINSIGISILIGVIEAIEECEGLLAFTNLTPTNRKTFEMMGLLQFAKPFDKEEEAVKEFKG